MADWSGYVLLRKPPILSMANWRRGLAALARALDRRGGSSAPRERLHWRASLDGTEVILQARFERDDLTVPSLARVLVAAVPGYSEDQVRTWLARCVVIWEGADWQASGDAARAYLVANRARWEQTAQEGGT